MSLPPNTVGPPPPDLKPLNAARDAAAASLAAGIIGTSGRSFSLAEAFEVFTDVRNTLYPMPGHGRYEAWKSAHDPNKRYDKS